MPRIPADILEGYPSHLAEELPDYVGRFVYMPAAKDLGRCIFLFYFSNPPWHCEFCGEPILYIGQMSDSLNIHHGDGDRENNKLVNLVPSHHSCHQRHHNNLAIRFRR